jgi:hypothetical protein
MRAAHKRDLSGALVSFDEVFVILVDYSLARCYSIGYKALGI